ncbi:hypothetical protein EG328_000732 [Venturia inaequalis]|uniref:ADP-ribose 1''-phosphate phosphatase n=1 Tax=Venturia inaequalis TaxID=5025 RepID=A0A8H3UYK1_VENIN|nr:hypothetical protein EG328_000732 [Venturia inaequalis]
MSTKRKISPSGTSRALKQTKLIFGKKMATPLDHQPQHTMATKRNKAPEIVEGSKSGDDIRAIVLDKSDSDGKNSSADVMPKSGGTVTYASMASKAAEKDKKQMSPTQSPSPSNSKTFVITDRVGDIFDAPDGAVIIHACNCMGSWAAGIAAAFKQRYPKAFAKYALHCKQNTPNSLWGTALLIPPMETKGPRHYVGCLFTSRRYGRGKDSPAQILAKTGPAMEILVEMMRKPTAKDTITEIRICQINSGLFSVPWEKSKAIIEELEIGDGDLRKEIIVYTQPTS